MAIHPFLTGVLSRFHSRVVHPALSRGQNTSNGRVDLLHSLLVRLGLRPAVMIEPAHLFGIGQTAPPEGLPFAKTFLTRQLVPIEIHTIPPIFYRVG